MFALVFIVATGFSVIVPFINSKSQRSIEENNRETLKINNRENEDVVTYQQMAENYNNEGLVFYNQGDYDKAIEYYDKAIELEKYEIENMDICYYNRGRAYFKLEIYEQALLNYSLAINIKERAKYYSDRSIVYEKLGDVNKSSEDALKAAMLMFVD